MGSLCSTIVSTSQIRESLSSSTLLKPASLSGDHVLAPSTISVHGMKWERETPLVLVTKSASMLCTLHYSCHIATLTCCVLFLELFLEDATVRKSENKGEICLSCSFLLSDVKTDSDKGCSLKLQSNMHTFVFNITRHDDSSLVLLECFSVREAGEYNVHVYEIQNGRIIEYASQQLDNIVISESECVCVCVEN